MPKGIKKQINLDEELAIIDNKIAFHSKHIKQLKEKKDILLQKQQKNDVKSLLSTMKDLDLDATEVITILKTKNKEKVG